MYQPRKSTRNPEKVINDLDFADDIVLLETCITAANNQLDKLREEAAQVGLVINEEKNRSHDIQLRPLIYRTREKGRSLPKWRRTQEGD